MKIFVDENIPLMTVRALREMGHENQTASKFGCMIQQRNILIAWNAVHDN
jgi:predicted nuclease of predicted toxin-antitoxin system